MPCCNDDRWLHHHRILYGDRHHPPRNPRGRTKDIWRQVLLDWQNGKCFYCEVMLQRHDLPRNHHLWLARATFDHLNPTFLGGVWTFDNLVLACTMCNNCRQTMPYRSFKRLIQELKEVNSSLDRKEVRKAVKAWFDRWEQESQEILNAA